MSIYRASPKSFWVTTHCLTFIVTLPTWVGGKNVKIHFSLHCICNFTFKFLSFLHSSAPPIHPDSPHIWLLWFFSKSAYCKSLRGRARRGVPRKKICEGKGVENIKARRRERKRGQGKKIITGGKQWVKQHISRKRQSEQGRSRERDREREAEICLAKNSGLRQRFVCLSTSRSQYGAVPVLQDARRSVQPQPLLHLFCSCHIWLFSPDLALIMWPLSMLS